MVQRANDRTVLRFFKGARQLARYFFHICCADRITLDDEGIELAGITEAHTEARLSARDIAMAAMRSGLGTEESEIQIADGWGKVLGAVTARSTLN